MIDINKINFNYSKAGELDEIRKYLEEQSFKNLDKNKKTIFMNSPSFTGTAYWRLILPLLAMVKKYPDKYNYCYSEHEGFPIEWLKKTDLWIQHRAGSANSMYLKFVKLFPIDSKKPIVIHDVDDDEINLPETHPMKVLWLSSGKDQMAKYQLSNVDYVTTTGKQLQREFSKYNKFENIKIFKNSMDWDLPMWKYEKENRKYPTIFWAGLTSHYEDLKKMSIILKIIHDKYPNVKFCIAGISKFDEFFNIKEDENGKKIFEKQNITDEKVTYKYRVTELFKDFDKNRIELMGILSHEEYGKFYSYGDINLAYVEHNQFNKAKSNIKILEGGIYKSINIYSNFGGYEEFTYNAPINLKKELLKHCAAQTENILEWTNNISFWIDNYKTDLWNKVVEEQYNYIYNDYNIYNQIDERVKFYDEILKKEKD